MLETTPLRIRLKYRNNVNSYWKLCIGILAMAMFCGVIILGIFGPTSGPSAPSGHRYLEALSQATDVWDEFRYNAQDTAANGEESYIETETESVNIDDNDYDIAQSEEHENENANDEETSGNDDQIDESETDGNEDETDENAVDEPIENGTDNDDENEHSEAIDDDEDESETEGENDENAVDEPIDNGTDNNEAIDDGEDETETEDENDENLNESKEENDDYNHDEGDENNENMDDANNQNEDQSDNEDEDENEGENDDDYELPAHSEDYYDEQMENEVPPNNENAYKSEQDADAEEEEEKESREGIDLWELNHRHDHNIVHANLDTYDSPEQYAGLTNDVDDYNDPLDDLTLEDIDDDAWFKDDEEEERDENGHVSPFFPAEIPLPSQQIIDEYHASIRVISYQSEDMNKALEAGLIMHPMSDPINQFHSYLMKQNGVDPNYYNVQFKVIEDIDAQCFTQYAYSYNAGFMSVECSDPSAMITGCTSYRPTSEGYRFGEGSKEGMECYTNPQSDGYTRLSARCCTGMEISNLTDYANSNSQNCINQGCDDLYETLVGCAAHSHSPMTNSYNGVKVVVDDEGVNQCQAQRGEDGYFWVQPYCVSDMDITCYSVLSQQAEFIEELGVYEAKATCSTAAPIYGKHEMTDCNSYIEMNDEEVCNADNEWTTMNEENHGGWMQGSDCIAHGTSEKTIAQATCCNFGSSYVPVEEANKPSGS